MRSCEVVPLPKAIELTALRAAAHSLGIYVEVVSKEEP